MDHKDAFSRAKDKALLYLGSIESICQSILVFDLEWKDAFDKMLQQMIVFQQKGDDPAAAIRLDIYK